MRPAESAIADSIDALSPGEFQELAERYAQVRYPDRFRHLIPVGRTKTGQTRTGWPDGCVHLADGRLDAVEATRDKKNWRGHLENDLEQAEQLGKESLAGFLFVAWAPTPAHTEVASWYEKFRQCGVPEDRLALVFCDELTRSLSEPAYADIWTSMLGLPTGTQPFVPIKRAPIFGSGELDQFVPTVEEHEAGVVHRSDVAEIVEDRLDRDRWAFVRGRGSAGKTVLAAQIALSTYRGSPSYYLDLAATAGEASITSSQLASEAIATRAASNVLFVVDNVHRDEGAARAIFDFWSEAGGQSRLLLLGRWTMRGSDIRGIVGSVEDLNREAVPLNVEGSDLRGVFDRLVARTEGTVPTPQLSSTLLAQWRQTFGGDLVAFSFAIATKLQRKEVDNWVLLPKDARRYVQEQYLQGLDREQRAALELLATLSTLEIPASAELVDLAAIEESLANGLVHQVDADGTGPLYQLVHPGIGILLLDALGLGREVPKLLLQAAAASPPTGFQIAARLEAERRGRLAKATIREALQEEGALLKTLVGGGLQMIGREIALAVRLGAMDAGAIDDELSAKMEMLAPGLIAGPIKGLVELLEVSRQHLPRVHAALIDAMSEQSSIEQLAASLTDPRNDARWITALFVEVARYRPLYRDLLAAISGPDAAVNLVASFLRLRPKALAKQLRASHQAPEYAAVVARALSSDESVPRLTQYLTSHATLIAPVLEHGRSRGGGIRTALNRAATSPELVEAVQERFRCGDIATIDRMADALDPYRPSFRGELVARFDDHEFAREAIEARLVHTGANLIRLLERTWTSFPQLARRILAELQEHDYTEALAEACLKRKPATMRGILEPLLREVPEVGEAVLAALTSPPYESRLAERLRSAPTRGMLRFLQLDERRLLSWISRQEGGLGSFFAAKEKIRVLPLLARSLKLSQDAAVRESVSMGLFDLDEIGLWHRRGLSVDHLSSALVVGAAQPLEARLAWLEQLATMDGWDGLRIDWRSPTSLFNVWLWQEPAIVAALGNRMDPDALDSLVAVMAEDPQRVVRMMRVVGVARLFGFSVAGNGRFDSDVVRDALLRAHQTNRPWLTHAQAEAWIGASTLLEEHDELAIPDAAGEQALELLRATRHQTPREQQLQADLLRWLADARANDWRASGETLTDMNPALYPATRG